jgi:hypothetical protein
MNWSTFRKLVLLITLGILLWHLGQWGWVEFQTWRLEGELKELREERDRLLLNDISVHIDRCRKQGYRGNGC